MCGLLHTWILIFDIAIPYLRPNKATNWNFLVPRGLFVTKSPISSPFSLAQNNCRREESPNMWHTYLGQVFIFLKDLRRVIMKTEVRKMIFGHAVIAWIFLLIFYFCKIKSFGHSKVRFQGKKQKDMADDGTVDKILSCRWKLLLAKCWCFQFSKYVLKNFKLFCDFNWTIADLAKVSCVVSFCNS